MYELLKNISFLEITNIPGNKKINKNLFLTPNSIHESEKNMNTLQGEPLSKIFKVGNRVDSPNLQFPIFLFKKFDASGDRKFVGIIVPNYGN